MRERERDPRCFNIALLSHFGAENSTERRRTCVCVCVPAQVLLPLQNAIELRISGGSEVCASERAFSAFYWVLGIGESGIELI